MRRGALNDMAIENGCNKVALGHHNDDVLETFFLSLMHEGRIHCFSPVTYLDRTDMYQIRPMITFANVILGVWLKIMIFPLFTILVLLTDIRNVNI